MVEAFMLIQTEVGRAEVGGAHRRGHPADLKAAVVPTVQRSRASPAR